MNTDKRTAGAHLAILPFPFSTACLTAGLVIFLVLAAGLARAEQYTVYDLYDLYAQPDNNSSLEDCSFFLVEHGAPEDEQIDMMPLRYVVWNKIQTMDTTTQGIMLNDSFTALGLLQTYYYNSENPPLYYIYPNSFSAMFNEMDGVIEYMVQGWNSSQIVYEPSYAPYAEYYVDQNTVLPLFHDCDALSPIRWEMVSCDMPYHITSSRERNSLRREVDMSGSQHLVERARQALGEFYETSTRQRIEQARVDGWDVGPVPDAFPVYLSGHAFADVDGDGAMDFIAGAHTRWESMMECADHPVLVVVSSMGGTMILDNVGCFTTNPLGLADFNGDSVLDIVTYSSYWEWDDTEVFSLAGGTPVLMGVTVW